MDTTALLRHTSRFPVFQNGNLGDLACLDIYYKELQEKRGAQNIVSFYFMRSTLVQTPICSIRVYYIADPRDFHCCFLFWVKVLLCSLSKPGTHYVQQAGLQLRELSSSVSQVHKPPWPAFIYFEDRVSLCCPDWLGNHYVDQSGLEAYRDPPASVDIKRHALPNPAE